MEKVQLPEEVSKAILATLKHSMALYKKHIYKDIFLELVNIQRSYRRLSFLQWQPAIVAKQYHRVSKMALEAYV